jgi:hypothetical protein
LQKRTGCSGTKAGDGNLFFSARKKRFLLAKPHAAWLEFFSDPEKQI